MLRSQPRVQEGMLLFLGNDVGRVKSQEREAQAHFPETSGQEGGTPFPAPAFSPQQSCDPLRAILGHPSANRALHRAKAMELRC